MQTIIQVHPQMLTEEALHPTDAFLLLLLMHDFRARLFKGELACQSLTVEMWQWPCGRSRLSRLPFIYHCTCFTTRGQKTGLGFEENGENDRESVL